MHVARFEGANERFRSFLSTIALVATVFQLGFLVVVGLRLGWMSPVKLLGIEFLLFIPVSFILAWATKNISRDSIPVLSLLGFIVLPVSGFIMFRVI